MAMDDLPELPLEKVLSYLTLEDLFKSRVVCRAWCNLIDRFRVKCLFYSDRPCGFIFPKSRLVGRAFAANFVRSFSFERFFRTYSQSILSSLKKLRFCELQLPKSSLDVFVSTLQSFHKLEHLSFIRTYLGCELIKVQSTGDQFLNPPNDSDPRRSFNLNFPMLESLHFEEFFGLRDLTLDAPRLRSLTFISCDHNLKVELVHADSVEWLDTRFHHVILMKLKNLKYFFDRSYAPASKKLLHSQSQLKEFHLIKCNALWELFELSEQYGLVDLKFYLDGCLVNGTDDPLMEPGCPILPHLADNPSRMADHILYDNFITYDYIAHFSSEFVINFLNRCSNLITMGLRKPVEDIERFLHVLENSNYIAEIRILGEQPQELLDRLSEHCAVQKLGIGNRPLWRPTTPFNLAFLFRLKHLMFLTIDQDSISVETVRKVFEELRFLLKFEFPYANKQVTMEVVNLFEAPKLFKVRVDEQEFVGDTNAAIQFVTNLQ